MNIENLELLADQIDLLNLYNEDDLCIRIKGHIIICRRKNEYDEDFINEQFVQFKTIINDNIESIIKNFNSRWLLSILECYIDCGNYQERAGALAISSIIVWERCKLLIDGNKPFSEWHDGLKILSNTKNVDSHINLFSRINLSLTDDTRILTLEIIKRLFQKDDFTLNQLEALIDRKIKEDVLEEFNKDKND